MMDDHGQPQAQEAQEQRTDTDTEQTVSMNTQQVAQQLGIDARTVRRHINEGVRTPAGKILKLKARQVQTNRGPEWQVYQNDLDQFQEERNRAATEGHSPSGQQLMKPEDSQALVTTSLQLLATELERRSTALVQAQETIERLAREAGQQAGRAQELERELELSRQQVRDLEVERDHWQQKAQVPAPAQPRKVRLFPFQIQKKD